MRALKVALRPENEAPRRPWPVKRGTTVYVSSNNVEDSTTSLRLQRLSCLGIIGQRASLLADLAWEGGV